MLTLHENAGLSRRQLLNIGTLAMGGLALPSILGNQAKAAGNRSFDGRSVIFVFQQGGPPQFETYDPKMEAPTDIRTITGQIQTALPGVFFGDTMQQLARLANKVTIVRSFQTENGGHNIRPIVGPETLNANMGSIVSRVIGSTHPTTGMPRNAVLLPQSVTKDVTKGAGRGDLAATGTFGSTYAPFMPGGGGQLMRDLRLNLSPERFRDRRELLGQIDTLRRQMEAESQFQGVDQFHRQAGEVLLNGQVANALDLSKEDPQVLERFDTTRFAARDNWQKANRGKRGYYTGHAKSFGKCLLLARRLCEAGCGFVTVHADYEGVWDFHADGNNLNVKDGMEAVGRSFDHGLATLISDIEARGLQDKILVIATGEMGRTPRVNRNGGRDHWAKLAPLLLYGGGAAGGRVIGQSTRDGGEPANDPYTSRSLISTVLHHMLDVPQLRLNPAFAEISRLAEVAPIPALG